MFKSQEFNAVKVIILIVVIALLAWFVLGKFNHGLTGQVINKDSASEKNSTNTNSPQPQTASSFLLFGGASNNGQSRNDVWRSNSTATSWNLISPDNPNPGITKWTQRERFTSVYFNNKVFLTGGISNFSMYKDVWYTDDGIIWKQVTNNAPWAPLGIGNGLYSHTLTVFLGKMWVIGGTNYGWYNSGVWSSGDGANWNQTASGTDQCLVHRWEHQTVVFNGKLWLLGGGDLSGPNVVSYDICSSVDGINWTPEVQQAPWGPRGRHMAAVFNGKIWIFSGWQNVGTSNLAMHSDIWYSTDGINWTQAPTPTIIWQPRFLGQVAVANNKIWIFGGHGFSNPLNDIWSSTDGLQWTQVTQNAPWPNLVGHNVVVVPW